MPPRKPSTPPHQRESAAISTVLSITPISIITLTIILLLYTVTHPPIIRSHPPTLSSLLSRIADALDHAHVPFWLMPRQFFRAATPATLALTPWQEAVRLAVLQQNLMHVLLAQASLQEYGIVAVESYFGLRLFHISGTYQHPYDFNTPFVDLLYFRERNHTLANTCCDCGPVTIGPCTKKLCTCLQCAFPEHAIFPLTSVHIQSVTRSITAPRETSSLLIPSDHPVHPTAFTSIHSRDT